MSGLRLKDILLSAVLLSTICAEEISENISIACIPKSTCKQTKPDFLRIFFDTSKNIHIFCSELKMLHFAEAYPNFDIHKVRSINTPSGLNLTTIISKCQKTKPKYIKYFFPSMTRNIINVTSESFSRNINLRDLTIGSTNENALLSLQADFLVHFAGLKYLTLERTNLNEVNIDFKTIASLESLRLVFNQIDEITENSFKSLTNLKTLALPENQFRSIQPGSFTGLSSLVNLDLSRNFLTNLSPNVFDALVELRRLNLNRNDIESIHIETFKEMRKLEFLDLSGNMKLAINDSVFGYLSKLKYLNMSYCKVTEITAHLFNGAENLKYVSLSYNHISQIEPKSFDKLSNLQYLNISGNRIQTFDWQVYENIGTLRILDLAYNKIKTVKRLPNNGRLEKLNLRSNEIDSIPELSAGIGTLKSLDIGFNKLKGNLKLKRDYPKSGVFDINLIRNYYTNIDWSEPNQDLSSHKGKTSINFQENRLSCDCEKHIVEKCFHFPDCLQSDWMQLDIDSEKIDCIWNEYRSDGDPYHVSCPIINVYGTPKECQFYYKENREGNLEPSLVLDCSLRNLTALPSLENFKFGDTTFAEKTYLLLNGNKLKSFLKHDMDDGYERITNLNLSNNFIENVDGIPKNIQVVDFSGNQLTNLDSEVLEDFEIAKSLKRIILNDNPWKCDCDSEKLKDYLINNINLKVEEFDVYCESNENYLVYSKICGENTLQIILPATIAVIFAVTSIIMAFYFRYKTNIKIWLYSKNLCMWWVAEEDADKDKTYDVFVSYSYKDEEFVRNHLLPEMEKPEKKFKVCVHYRDWIPGEFISKQITKSVLDSRRTLVVLSNNFMESVWGKMEFRTAHTQAISENKIRVIVVIYGELDDNNVDDEMKAYLKTNTYVKWGDPWFWNKLKYALPHSTHKSDQTAEKTSRFIICCNWFNRSTHHFHSHTENINMAATSTSSHSI